MTYRVVVVEDTEATRYLQSTWLRRAGFDVVEVASGREALDVVDADVDVVVLDVNLPDMSGMDVCAQIKAAPATAAVPVMHVSATAVDLQSRVRGLDRGADAYLVEPVDREEYLATVRSLGRTRSARRSADELSRRLGRLAAAMVPVNAADSLARLLEAAAQGAADVFAAPALAVAETEGGTAVRALAPGPRRETLSRTFGGRLSPEWTGGPRYLPGDGLPYPWPDLLERASVTVGRWFVSPLRRPDGGMLVGLAVGVPGGQDRLADAEERILAQLAQSVAVALGNLRAYSQEHRTALTLQNALLPGRLPAVPGLSFTARYAAASETVSVGGDFYDAFALPSGDVAVVIGDVQGHSLQAALQMAELRFSLRAFMVEHRSPERVVELLNALLLTYHPDVTATLVLLVVERSLERMQVVNAGHLPVLVVDGGAALLEGDGTLLGVPGPAPRGVSVPLAEGTSVVLVTDGLIERRGQSLSEGLDLMLAVAAEDPGRTADELADALVDRFGIGDAEDDVAVVVMRRDTVPG